MEEGVKIIGPTSGTPHRILSNQIKKNEISEACNTYEGKAR
jgi:hypothetical protein